MDQDFLEDILQQPPPALAYSPGSESEHTLGAIPNDGVVLSKSDSSNSLVSQNANSKRPRRCSSPRTFILSFDNSTMVPATPEPCCLRSSPLPTKRARESPGPEPRRPNDGPKKIRTSSQTMDHIMAERRRRQELTERFIALSATIPGLNKTDKASVLRAAIDYVRELKERVHELERQDEKRSAESVIFIKKLDPDGNNNNNNEDITTTTETNCSTLPEMEARVLGKEVLIEIHCKKQHCVELKILDHLENLHLSVTGSSVLPFGNSALCITITAQMGEGYQMTVNDIVKNLRQVLSKSHVLSDSDPY